MAILHLNDFLPPADLLFVRAVDLRLGVAARQIRAGPVPFVLFARPEHFATRAFVVPARLLSYRPANPTVEVDLVRALFEELVSLPAPDLLLAEQSSYKFPDYPIRNKISYKRSANHSPPARPVVFLARYPAPFAAYPDHRYLDRVAVRRQT